MNRVFRAAVRAATLAALYLAGATTSLTAQEGLAVGTRAPVLRLATLTGDTIDLGRYIGRQPVLLEFWATWCPLCRQLEPTMRTAHERYGRDVAFISVTVPNNQTPERARAYVEQHELPGRFVFDAAGAAVAAYRVPHTSYVVLIDRAGTIVYTGVGGTQDIVAELARLR